MRINLSMNMFAAVKKSREKFVLCVTDLHQGERRESVALALAVGGVGGDEVAALACPVVFGNILQRNVLTESFLSSLPVLYDLKFCSNTICR